VGYLYTTLLQFPTESNSERILKIGQYLVKLWARVRCLVFFDSRCIFRQYAAHTCAPCGAARSVAQPGVSGLATVSCCSNIPAPQTPRCNLQPRLST